MQIRRGWWQLPPCSRRSDHNNAIVPTLQKLTTYNLSILYYSGDFDSVVAPAGTTAWLRDYGFTAVTPQQPWYWPATGDPATQNVAGYVTKYANNLWFTTIRGAGHLVPMDQPGRALAMVSTFITTRQLS